MNETLICAVIGHLVGDYILQNDTLAIGKKKNTVLCVIHCMLWTAAVVAFSGWYKSPNYVWIAAILYSTHFIQDRTNVIVWLLRLKWVQPQFSQPPLAPWSIIVVDNVWHIVTIWAVWKFVV